MNYDQLISLAHLLDSLQEVESKRNVRITGDVSIDIAGEVYMTSITWNETAGCYSVEL